MSNPDLSLSPNQKNLLRAALASNQVTTNPQSAHSVSSKMSEQTAPGSGHLDFSDDSPFLDFGLDGELDDSYNFEGDGQMIGDLPDEPSSRDLHDKRKSFDGLDDDDEGGGKRREGDDKAAKKPGRKPLTQEPTTKRKAQNRAAQRAFRERKERHLKDLETKVEDLEKASESQTHENGLLRAQVERLQIELREYRKRLSWMTTGAGRPQQQSTSQQSRNSGGGNDFQFEFPKFGDLPAANFKSPEGGNMQDKSKATSTTSRNVSASPASAAAHRQASIGSGMTSVGSSPMNNYSMSPSSQSFQGKNSVDSLSGLFSPSLLETTRKNSLGYFPETQKTRNTSIGRTSFDTLGSVPGLISGSSTNTDSPGSTADSQNHTSSMGTSPEPLFNSPNKQDYGLGAVEEDQQLNTFDVHNFSTDLNASGFDWLAQQNGGSFDPILFGDYRETQDNILSQDFGTFFNDAYPLPDLGSPMHNYGEISGPPTTTLSSKPDLMKQMDAVTNGEEVVPAEKAKMLTCNKIWDRLQSMEKFRNGEIDIDNLCSELRAKAKCSEGGAVVDEKHVNKLLGLS